MPLSVFLILKEIKMKRIINNIFLAGVLLIAYSCAEPTNPTPTEMVPGNWEVVEFYVNGQTNGSNIFRRFILERDNSFVLEDTNGILFAGDWNATADALTLNATDGTAFNFSIIFISYDKMQLVQTISSPTAGELEIRYLLDRDGNNSRYGNQGN
jgi:hypothetical protein